MKDVIITIACLVSYVLIAGATYGYSYHQYECGPTREPGWCAYDKQSSAGMNALGWPLYWPGHIARKVMEP